MSRLSRVGRRSLMRTGESADLLVVGLGNPGEEFSGTRHNVGHDVSFEIAKRTESNLRKSNALASVAEVKSEKKFLVLAVPHTYMNESGEAVNKLMRRYGISETKKLLIVHDELDLPVGTVRLKNGGGLAGHNGLRSVKAHLKSQEFCRIRIGIDRPSKNQNIANYVLSKPRKNEREELNLSTQIAADAVESIIRIGLESSMRVFNSMS